MGGACLSSWPIEPGQGVDLVDGKTLHCLGCRGLGV